MTKMTKYLPKITGTIVGVTVIVFGMLYFKVPTTVQGAITGPDVYFRMNLHNGLTMGTQIAATSSTATPYTTSSTDFEGLPRIIRWTNGGNAIIRLSATSTFGYVPNIGDVAQVVIKNLGSGSLTLAAVDANTDLQIYELTAADLVITSGKTWRLEILRTGTYSIAALVNEFQDGD